MIHQLALAIDAHAPTRRRSLDLTSLKSHALKLFDAMAAEIRLSPQLRGVMDTDPGAEFIFGGYDWVKKEFEIWSVRFNPETRRFAAHPPQSLAYLPSAGRVVLTSAKRPRGEVLGRVLFAGDQAPKAQESFLRRFPQGMRQDQMKIDWEPFETVRDMLREPGKSETIGGPPQIVKVYQYMDAAVLGVHWPDRATGRVHLQGRPCLGYERIERFVLDPDTLWTAAMTQPGVLSDEVGSTLSEQG